MTRTTVQPNEIGCRDRMRIEADARTSKRSEGQHGAFNRGQAILDGHTKRTIQYRLERGLWRQELPSVYVLAGTPDTWELRQMAACLWAREGLTAGKAAGALYGLPDCVNPDPEVMSSRRVLVPHSGIIVHHTTWLPWEQISRVNRIPVTSVERTLMSLCAQLTPRRAAIVVDQAITRGLTTLAGIDRHLARTARKGRDGCKLLRELKAERWSIGTVPTTPLETLIFEMIVRQDLPRPTPQVAIFDRRGRFVARPDFLYQEERLVIEGHSRQWHAGFQATKDDETRFDKLAELGYRMLFVTWADVMRNEVSTVALIRRLLEDREFVMPWRPAEWT